MPRLVEQLQADSLDPNVTVSTLLRKVKLAAVKLKLGKVSDWVHGELTGYVGEVPEYRVIFGRPVAHNPFNGWIPIHGNAVFMETISKLPLHQSIPEIESLISRDSGELLLPYAPRIIDGLNGMLGVQFARMGLSVDRSTLVGIVDSVRNAVLDWSLDLERAGVMGTGMGFSNDDQRKAASVSINIGTFSGNLHSGDLNGTGARLTQGGTDNSTNQVHHGFSFEKLEEAIERDIRSANDREHLLALTKEMRSSVGTSQFTHAYQRFIGAAATYMTILGPFIPALSGLLGAPT